MPSEYAAFTLDEFASTVHRELEKNGRSSPDESVLKQLLGTLYYASLKTEERHPITCHVAYMRPPDPDDSSLKGRLLNSCRFWKWNEEKDLTVSNVVKASMATDPRSSALAVYPDPNDLDKLKIWGLVDQCNRRHDFVNQEYDSDYGPLCAGDFQIEIRGTGHIAAYLDYFVMAEVRVNEPITTIDVLAKGTVHDKLTPAIKDHVERVWLDAKGTTPCACCPPYLKKDWVRTLTRMLKRIQGYGHGGTVLITPSPAGNLLIKYGVDYGRLGASLSRYGAAWVQEERTIALLDDKCERNEAIPAKLYKQGERLGRRVRTAENELSGCIWFVSLLSRVDGLVLLSPQLQVQGYGVEIRSDSRVDNVYIATGPYANVKKLEPRSCEHYGTRHRSMMRYCHDDKKAVGFVISQDGDVRAMTNVMGRVVMWENVRLERFTYVGSHKRARRADAPQR